MPISMKLMSIFLFSFSMGFCFSIGGPNDLKKGSDYQGTSRLGSIRGKGTSAFRAQPRFTWVEQKKGIGLVELTLEAESFVLGEWEIEWLLPDTTYSSAALKIPFQLSERGQTLRFELEVLGLKPHENQNVIAHIRPLSKRTSVVSVVVPTHFEQTLEAKAIEEWRSRQPHFGLKASGGISQIPRGIRF